MATLTLKRTGQMVIRNGAHGEISKLDVDGLSLWALERRDNHITLDEGAYAITMEMSPTVTGRRQFRVKHSKLNQKGEAAPILIHAANFPGELLGCIAPGLTLLNDGVDQSRPAMEKIFALCGGFSAGRSGKLIVAKN